MEASKLLLTGLVLITCAFICQLIGLASPYWVHVSYEISGIKAHIHIGLWKSCVQLDDTHVYECSDPWFFQGI